MVEPSGLQHHGTWIGWRSFLQGVSKLQPLGDLLSHPCCGIGLGGF